MADPKSRRRWFGATLVLWAALTLWPGGTLAATRGTLGQLEVLGEILQLARKQYVDEVDLSVLLEGAIDGVLQQLDPHSNYLPPKSFDEMSERIQGSFYGIGVYFTIRDNYLTVISPVEDSPSDHLGIRAGDRIVEIEGESAIGITYLEVKHKLRGPQGTKVRIGVERDGEDDLLYFTITRDKIPIRSVPYAFLIRPGTGYIRVAQFNTSTSQELEEALSELESAGMERLLLDLRGNGGGLLSQAVEVTDKFLSKGMIVYTQGRTHESRSEYHATAAGTHPGYPVVLLINEGSASASEILSGALQDWDRALVVGRPSFGKGSVQSQYPLRNGGAVLLTVSKWYTPSGRLIHKPLARAAVSNLEQVETDTSRSPVYHTAGGRLVYGGGGIKPDVTVEPAALLDVFVARLRTEGRFLGFATEYVATHSEPQAQFEAFLAALAVDDAALDTFHAYLVKQGVELDEEAFAAGEDFIRRSIKAEIAGVLWGRSERYQVAALGDPEIEKALGLFEQAAMLLAGPPNTDSEPWDRN